MVDMIIIFQWRKPNFREVQRILLYHYSLVNVKGQGGASGLPGLIKDDKRPQ